jgi:hypothetical protein
MDSWINYSVQTHLEMGKQEYQRRLTAGLLQAIKPTTYENGALVELSFNRIFVGF